MYKGNKIEFEETKNYHHISGYIGRTCPSLGTGYGSFHSELVIFSNLDNFRINNSLNNKDILIKETPDAEWAICYLIILKINLKKMISIIELKKYS